MYNKGIKSAEDDEFQHLNQFVDDPLGGVPDIDNDEDAESGEEDEGEDEDEEEEEAQEEVVTPFKPTQVLPAQRSPSV
jgi:hypothetical protein